MTEKRDRAGATARAHAAPRGCASRIRRMRGFANNNQANCIGLHFFRARTIRGRIDALEPQMGQMEPIVVREKHHTSNLWMISGR
jgi:hypothetical protein